MRPWAPIRTRCASTAIARSRSCGEEHDGLEPGTETDDAVRVAGRLLLIRRQGKLTFATLRDGTGEVQLFVSQNVIGPERTRRSTISTSATGSASRAR